MLHLSGGIKIKKNVFPGIANNKSPSFAGH